MKFNWKLAAIRWAYGALTPFAVIVGEGLTTGKVDWYLGGVAALSGLLAAVLVDLHSFLKASGDAVASSPEGS